MDIDDLYGAPLEQFVPQRTALTRELRNEGRRSEATAVAALRKPSVAAWAVNQLIRTQGGSVKELFGAGDALRKAHEQAASGRGDAQGLREASQRERAAVDTLVDAARGLLTSDGHELSPAVIDRVTDTLRAAALDSDARSKVNEGRLERELRHVGLGFMADPIALPAPVPRRAAKGKKRREDAEGERAAEAQQRERERKEALKAARAAESEARRQLQRAERGVEVARKQRDKAVEALDRAEEELATAEAEAQAAGKAHRRAAQALERL